jgi:pyruvate dehydrogenase E2 component (dihydrolipoamide acetyltransferase)
MPKLSPTMEVGTIVKWRKKEGDAVKPGEVLMEVATDKATVEHNAIDAGYLRKILVPEKGEAVVNQPLAIFTEKKDESIEGYMPEGTMPNVAPKGEEKKEEESKPAAKPVPMTSSGLANPRFIPEPPLSDYQFTSASESTFASPLARKLAKERNIDLTTVKGTGPNHRITSRDLDLGQPSGLVTFGRQETPTIAPGTYEEETLSPMRKVIGQRLQESKTFIPHFYVFQEVNAEPMVQLRTQLKNLGLSVSFNDFVIRACALTLRLHPVINSGYHSVNNTVIRFKTIDISVAVSVEGGLITPIIRHADFKNLGELGSEMKQLAKRARDGKLTREEYVGGSFTISNLGMFGITEFTAVINPPQAAILAVGGLNETPVVCDGTVVPGKMMRLVLSADHRVIDGAEAAKFMKDVQKLLENPGSLLL